MEMAYLFQGSSGTPTSNLAGGGGGGGEGDDPQLGGLLSMGFDREKAEFALRYFEGNLQKATDYLLQSEGERFFFLTRGFWILLGWEGG